jgi:hypothetical protein
VEKTRAKPEGDLPGAAAVVPLHFQSKGREYYLGFVGRVLNPLFFDIGG